MDVILYGVYIYIYILCVYTMTLYEYIRLRVKFSTGTMIQNGWFNGFFFDVSTLKKHQS